MCISVQIASLIKRRYTYSVRSIEKVKTWYQFYIRILHLFESNNSNNLESSNLI